MGRVFEVRKVLMVKIVVVKLKVYLRYGREIYMVVKVGILDFEIN